MKTQPHRTAIKRNGPSAPLRWLYENKKIHGITFLDYGCGRGEDVDWLREVTIPRRIDAHGYDPHFQPERPVSCDGRTPRLYYTVFMSYVVNVIEDPQERRRTVREAWKHVAPGGVLYVVSRSQKAIQDAQNDSWKKHQDGWITGSKTFQCGHSAEQLLDLLQGLPHKGHYVIHAPSTEYLVLEAWKGGRPRRRVNFVDAQERHRACPATFDVPGSAVLDSIQPGATVKVCVDDLERFWTTVIKVVKRQGRGSAPGQALLRIHAVVDNDLVCTEAHGLSLGDQIVFEPKHVYDVFSHTYYE